MPTAFTIFILTNMRTATAMMAMAVRVEQDISIAGPLLMSGRPVPGSGGGSDIGKDVFPTENVDKYAWRCYYSSWPKSPACTRKSGENWGWERHWSSAASWTSLMLQVLEIRIQIGKFPEKGDWVLTRWNIEYLKVNANLGILDPGKGGQSRIKTIVWDAKDLGKQTLETKINTGTRYYKKERGRQYREWQTAGDICKGKEHPLAQILWVKPFGKG